MSASPWADYLDARLRLVHQWMDEGRSAIEIVEKLTPTAVTIETVSVTPVDPPYPGCSRAQAEQWKERCARLETLLASRGDAISAAPPSRPVLSQIQALTTSPDPGFCGCQFWTDLPRPGEHHPECEHAPRE